MNPSRFGSDNGGSDPDALFLEVFAGEVLTAFLAANKFLDKHTVRTIESGKSAQFPVTGQGDSHYHTPGTLLTGTAVPSSQRIITIDDLLVADRFIASIDEAKSHFDIRSIYSRDIGYQLAKTFDQNVAQVMALAARASSTITGGNGGSQITDAAMSTDITKVIAAAFTAQQKLDEKAVPEGDRYIFVSPATYYALINSGANVTNRLYSDASNADLSKGFMYEIAGLQIVKTNHLPTTNITSGPTAYQGDFTKTVAIVSHPTAVGTVKLMDLAVEMEYLIQYQGTLSVAKFAMGHGILRPESAVELKTA